MAVAFGSLSSGIANGTGSSLGVPMPSAGSVGDFLVMFVHDDAASTSVVCTGWTVYTVWTHNATRTLTVLYRFSDLTEGGFQTVTGLSSTYGEGWAIRYTGVDPVTPINTFGTASQSRTSASMTTTVAGCMSLAVCDFDFGSVSAAAPSGWTRRLDGNGSYNLYAADRLEGSAGATATGDFSAAGAASSTYGVLDIAIAPPGGGGSTAPVAKQRITSKARTRAATR